jgi:UDPglucose 6-dehydrogenase
MKIGIIGQGFVGNAINHKFKKRYEIFAYDKLWGHVRSFNNGVELRHKSGTNAKKVVEESDIIFVCLPTPMYMDTGECDINIVRDAILELDKHASELGVFKIVIIKSTVPPGTTELINSFCTHLKVCFSPEFLTEANAVEDFNNQDRIVIGSDFKDYRIQHMFKSVFPKAKIFNIKSKEAEMIKYTANLFLATKVSFFNDIYDICDELDVNYKKVVEIATTDKRIGASHYQVPGPDGDRGFGGHCFPKDTAAIIHIADKKNIDVPTIKGMWETNKKVRNNKDWEKMDGRAVTKSKIEEVK